MSVSWVMASLKKELYLISNINWLQESDHNNNVRLAWDLGRGENASSCENAHLNQVHVHPGS